MQRRAFLSLTGAGLTAVAGCAGREETETTPDPPATEESDDSEAEPDDADEFDENESDGEADDEREDDEGEDDEEEPTLAVGELLEGERLHAVVDSVDRAATIEGEEPDTGSEFVVVELAVKNPTTDTSVELEGLSGVVLHAAGETTTVRTSDAAVRDPIAVRRLGSVQEVDRSRSFEATNRPSETVRLVPGEVERTALAYEVDREVSGLSLELGSDLLRSIGTDRATVDLDSRAESVASVEQDLQVAVNPIRQAVASQDVELAITEVRIGNDLDPFLEPEEGSQHVFVGVTVTNDSDEEILAPAPETATLKDETGRSYPYDPDAVSSLERIDEEETVGEGETWDGTFGYEVAEGPDHLYWAFDFGVWDEDEKTFWQLR